MIVASQSLMRALIREIERRCGSEAQIAYYDGMMPNTTEDRADGDKVATGAVPENFISDAMYGEDTPLLLGATYWRILSNDGLVVMQGDGYA